MATQWSDGPVHEATVHNNSHPSVTVLEGGDGPTLQLPHGDFLMHAEYGRSGADLTLEGTTHKVVVRDYFAADEPPALLSESCASYPPGDLVARLAGPRAPS